MIVRERHNRILSALGVDGAASVQQLAASLAVRALLKSTTKSLEVCWWWTSRGVTLILLTFAQPNAYVMISVDRQAAFLD